MSDRMCFCGEPSDSIDVEKHESHRSIDPFAWKSQSHLLPITIVISLRSLKVFLVHSSELIILDALFVRDVS